MSGWTPEWGQRLVGRVAIITGGAHGIGKAYALRFAQEGAKVVIFDFDDAAGKEVANEIRSFGGESIALRVDVTDRERIRTATSEVVEQYGGVDILINNAAMFQVVPMSRVPYDQIDDEEFDKMMEINIKGPWLMCCEVAKYMREKHYGKIINISSGVAFKGSNANIHYVTSKAAMLGFTRGLARELGKDGVLVNALAPGGTLSEDNPTEQQLNTRTATISSRPLERVELPEDLVGAAVFLASSDSDFMTGQTVVINGGDYMH